jgi:hypothetical protein
MNKIIALVVFGCLAHLPIAATGQITGGMRQEFLQSTEASCFRTQRSASVNKNLSDKTLVQYCRCFSRYLADSLNNALAISIYEGERKFNSELIEMGYRYCAKNFNNY